MKIDIDASECRALSVQWSDAVPVLARDGRRVIAKGLHNIKTQLQDEMRGRLTPKNVAVGDQIARFISYDVDDDGFGGEVGPEKSGAGNLGNIAYFGGAYGGGGTAPDPLGALEAEAPRTSAHLADLLAELLR